MQTTSLTDEMENSDWHNSQTVDRANQVIEVIRNGGAVVWEGENVFSQKATGHMAYGIKQLVIGD